MSTVFIFMTINTFAQIDNEANFYTPIANANYNRDLVADYGADNNFATDDSTVLQSAIDDINANGGGILTIPAGNYSISEINLKSNVHLDMDDDAVIRPSLRSNQSNYAIFNLGDITAPIQNISITSSSGNRFRVDLTQNNNPNVIVVKCRKVTNFLISSFNVDDSLTKFSAVTFGGDFFSSVYTYPENGIVKDIDIQNAQYGYGVVQTQSAENVLFKNLSATGGATLRFETGATGLNDLQGDNLPPGETKVGGLDNMVGRNISCTNGNSAVMLSPHAVHNGSVDVEGVTSVSSGFAVRVEGGFIASKYDQTINLTDGTFDYVRIKDVTATYGNTAELKSKHFKFYPPEISNPTTISSYDPKVYIGPSIAGLVVEGNYLCNGNTQTVFIEAPIVANGFIYQPTAIVPSENETISCGSLTIGENELKTAFELFPNPTSTYVNMRSSVNGHVSILDARGALLKTVSAIKKSKAEKLDLSGLSSGLYFLQLKSENEIHVKKFIIK
ncbi:T9SS type A sorting domain-containing protein [Flavivirga amylovorans]|uniref:T9SS type A sorting domain-containing protein n=1 Tax=Flavivirga amylovorans TaxID=870486 RepID=A0ABT8WX15_9FLAO|nr:T9SS type A sorting domain-containing protein [Flavivirga amylovorans]MDO5986224.1 T9SS type A sorting domain-containing protein [Flavivirga amylovorans]